MQERVQAHKDLDLKYIKKRLAYGFRTFLCTGNNNVFSYVLYIGHYKAKNQNIAHTHARTHARTHSHSHTHTHTHTHTESIGQLDEVIFHR